MQEKKERDYKHEYELSKKRVYQAKISLTIPEGEILKQIIADHGCKNLSQLCKKIVKGEISLH